MFAHSEFFRQSPFERIVPQPRRYPAESLFDGCCRTQDVLAAREHCHRSRDLAWLSIEISVRYLGEERDRPLVKSGEPVVERFQQGAHNEKATGILACCPRLVISCSR